MIIIFAKNYIVAKSGVEKRDFRSILAGDDAEDIAA